MFLTSSKATFRDPQKQCFLVFRALLHFWKHTFCMRGVAKIALGGAKKWSSAIRSYFSRKRRNHQITTVPGQFRREAKCKLADLSSIFGGRFLKALLKIKRFVWEGCKFRDRCPGKSLKLWGPLFFTLVLYFFRCFSKNSTTLQRQASFGAVRAFKEAYLENRHRAAVKCTLLSEQGLACESGDCFQMPFLGPFGSLQAQKPWFGALRASEEACPS